jgi:hypothetical protein
MSILTSIGHPGAEELRTKLRQLDQPANEPASPIPT